LFTSELFGALSPRDEIVQKVENQNTRDNQQRENFESAFLCDDVELIRRRKSITTDSGNYPDFDLYSGAKWAEKDPMAPIRGDKTLKVIIIICKKEFLVL
jgi:hypothetical protein